MRAWIRAAAVLAALAIVSTPVAESQEPGTDDPAAAIGVAVEAGIRERGVLRRHYWTSR